MSLKFALIPTSYQIAAFNLTRQPSEKLMRDMNLTGCVLFFLVFFLQFGELSVSIVMENVSTGRRETDDINYVGQVWTGGSKGVAARFPKDNWRSKQLLCPGVDSQI